VRHAALQPLEALPANLQSVELVYVRRGGALPPLSPPYAGPYRVLKRGKKFFTLQIGARVETISVDRIKPHVGVELTPVASPPTRGRPRLLPGPSDNGHDARSYAAVVAGGGYCSG